MTLIEDIVTVEYDNTEVCLMANLLCNFYITNQVSNVYLLKF